MEKLPKKILIIKDCTFILPDEFEGTTEEAFKEFLKYQADHKHPTKFVDNFGLFSTFNMLLYGSPSARVCGEYAVLEFKDGQYKLLSEPEMPQ